MTSFEALVGNTPLIKLRSLSDAVGVEVFGKAEFLNPGGSTKDRVACSIIDAAEKQGLLQPGGEIHEATSGSMGISLTLAANAKGYSTFIYMPDDVAEEKSDILRSLGANVVLCPTVSMADDSHFCKIAQQKANEAKEQNRNAIFTDQFDNPANFAVHYLETAEEVWKQMSGQVDIFLTSAGTGGTVSGIARKLKERNPQVRIILADPQGSALCGQVKQGVLFTPEDAEGFRRRIIRDTIVEGVGNNRLTRNFELGRQVIDDALMVNDAAVVQMSRWLVKHEGLFLGSSAALNCAAVVKASADGLIPRGARVLTILCDSGMRHLSKLYNDNYIRDRGILTPPPLLDCSAFDRPPPDSSTENTTPPET